MSAKNNMSELEQTFITLWRQVTPGAPQPEREYRFHPKRRWRFDFAWPAQRVAVEVEGGTWTRGRHSRGGGYRGDCEKYNAATIAGWRVLRFTAGMLKDEPWECVAQVLRCLELSE